MYVMPLATMLRSVIDNIAPDRSVEIFLLHSGISAADREKVTRGWPEARCVAHWVEVNKQKFSGLPLWGRMPVSTYFKLALPQMLPLSAAKAIWLDCDLLVLDDIGPFWDSDLRGDPLGAVQDAVVPFVSSRCGIASHSELGIPANAKYFNAGVMLVDLEQWRRGEIERRAIDYLKKYESSVVFWDQEALNAVLAGNWTELDDRWNHNASVPRGLPDGNKLPAIVHFAGSLKPWRYNTRHRLRSIYYEYLDKTPFAGWRPPPSLASTVVSIYEESGLRSLMYPAENIGMRMVRGLSRR